MSPKARIPPPELTVYAVVRADGTLKRLARRGLQKKGHLAVYTEPAVAKRQATDEGDSVVEARIDLSARPLFIRGELIDGGP